MLASWLRPAARLAIALGAAAAVWLFLMNRLIIHWVDAPWKTALELLLMVGLACAAIVAVRHPRRNDAVRLSLAVLGLFAVGEVRLAWLRSVYRASSALHADVWHPVTTTDLVVQRFTVEAPSLGVPRLRVLHVSDLHVTEGIADSYVDRVHDQMRALAPDLIVMTGDYLSRADRLPLLEKWLRGMPEAKLGAYAVLGNHDYWAGDPDGVRGALRRAGVHLVGGTCTKTDAALASLRICGTEEPWGAGYDADAGGSGGENEVTLVLTHTPDNVYAAAAKGATVLFAGHTHGGQFRLPGFGPLLVPSHYGRRFEEGHFVVDGTHLFVSAGVGADAPALRLWCPPELIVVDLVSAPRMSGRVGAKGNGG
jgi:predicted MPP superfamily phosphohydrolase